MPLKDLTGQKFNKLTVMYRAYPNTASGNARWHCICECGNECDVVGTSLKSGHTKSCGCLIKEHMATLGAQQGKANCENLDGQKFGMLTVIRRVYDNEQHMYKCLCKCDCGGEVLVAADKLKSGHTKSCGCVSSYGEKIINNYLANNHINFKTQIGFNDLIYIKKLRFDFGIYDKNDKLLCLIEFNGRQHYDKTSKFYTEEGVERDKLKQSYCQKHNIPLFILTSLDNLETQIEKILKNYDEVKE